MAFVENEGPPTLESLAMLRIERHLQPLHEPESIVSAMVEL